MTEDEALAWLSDRHDVSRETLERLDAFRRRVIDENDRQNLVSAASIDQFWVRHIIDSVQLIDLIDATDGQGEWLDLGAGAGFPGMVVAMLRPGPVTLVESRRKRFEFLIDAVETLGLSNVRVEGQRLERVESRPCGVISARAFAPLPKLLNLAHRFSTEKTLWLLPKGRSAKEELESVRQTWQGVFHVKQSITDPDAAILVARAVSRKGRKQAR